MQTKKPNRENDLSEPHGVTLNAVDVQHQTFTVKFRGYDTQDVDSFLEIVAREMERLTGRNRQLTEELQAARQELSVLRKKEENVNSALLTVEKLTEETRQKARAESGQLLEDAESRAEEIVAQAQQTAQAQQEESTQLRARAENEARLHVDAARQEAERILNAAHEKASQRHAEADAAKSLAQDQARALLDSSRQKTDTLLEQARAKNAEMQEAAARIRSRAEQEARMIIDKARTESSRLDEGLQQAHAKLQDEITALRQQKIQFETSFRALLETHLKLIQGNGGQQSE